MEHIQWNIKNKLGTSLPELPQKSDVIVDVFKNIETQHQVERLLRLQEIS
jgi:hypothetical protein